MTPPGKQVPAVVVPTAHGRITGAILDFVSEVPDSTVGNSPQPATEARRLADRAARRAAVTAGSLALPPGPLGWLTLLPELIAIWKIQAQMVSDIAAAYGRHATLGREQMLYCLFRHIAPAAFRDMVNEAGERVVISGASPRTLRAIAQKVGLRVSLRLMGKGLSRWVPVVGALGVGAYAYYDTGQVAATAINLFSREIEVSPSSDQAGP